MTTKNCAMPKNISVPPMPVSMPPKSHAGFV
jgi:hypothetical protein